jgi:hypothetical protein
MYPLLEIKLIPHAWLLKQNEQWFRITEILFEIKIVSKQAAV